MKLLQHFSLFMPSWLKVLVHGILCMALLTGCCQPNSCTLEPHIVYFPPERLIKKLPDCFPPLSTFETASDWGKELKIGETFARDFDFYRAITCFKRALCLIPSNQTERRLQIQYSLLLAYYLGGKMPEAIDIFENSQLSQVPPSFPGFETLLIVLWDAYHTIGDPDKACAIMRLIEEYNPQIAQDLNLYQSMLHGNIERSEELLSTHPKGPLLTETWLNEYCCCAKSPRKAQVLNAVLPGAGYYYVGQKKTALTSFLINTLFIAATYELFHHGYPAAGLIVGSLETGWYLGGINGAGLAAKEYNESLYSQRTKDVLIEQGFFPVLMFQCAF